MTTNTPASAQAPIHSGFGARSTADDVMAGIDLTGKLAIVTGGYSGLGRETTRALARAGARVVVPARRPEQAHQALAGLSGAAVETMDLADPESIDAFARLMVRRGEHVDIVINNAGIMACPEMRIGDGWESQFGTNHLGHFALVDRLWPLLADGKGARVVAVSSGAHRMTGIRWDDVQFARGYDKWLAYGQSKTANALFATELDRLGKASGVRAFAVHPGSILTPLQRHLDRDEMMAAGWIDADGNLTDPTFKSPGQGAATQVWAATSPLLDGRGGVYCLDCDIAPIDADEGTGVAPHAIDPDEAARLWTLSAHLTGCDTIAGGR